jgi:hypothetical protein
MLVVVVGWLFVAMGTVGFVYHAMEFRAQGPIEQGFFWVLALRLLAIVGGVFVLRGANWARWLLAAWLAYHVVLSAWHSLSEVIVHAAFLAIVAYVFFRARASGFFRKAA